MKVHGLPRRILPSAKDLLITVLILASVTGIGWLFQRAGFTESNIITVYILGVLLISLFTEGYAGSVLCSVLSVVLFNFFFTEPRLTFHAYDPGYPVTFVIMLAASIITGTLAAKLKEHAQFSARSAFRAKVLLNTSQLLQKAKDNHEIINITASQLVKLLDRDVIAYPAMEGRLAKGCLYCASPGSAVKEGPFSLIRSVPRLNGRFRRTRAQALIRAFRNRLPACICRLGSITGYTASREFIWRESRWIPLKTA